MKYTEDKLEQAIISLLGEQGYPHLHGSTIDREPPLHIVVRVRG